jgi:hypothetical protein
MIFSDEKNLWNSEQEALAASLANKSEDDIFEILENYRSILVKKGRARYTAIQRLIQILTVPLFPVLFLLMFIKWICTGDKYLDSWFCKIGLTSERTNKYFM